MPYILSPNLKGPSYSVEFEFSKESTRTFFKYQNAHDTSFKHFIPLKNYTFWEIEVWVKNVIF